MTRSSTSAARLVLSPNLLLDRHSAKPPGREGLFRPGKKCAGDAEYEIS